MTNKIENVIMVLVAVIILLLLLAFVGIEIYVWVKYGNTPIGDVPSWVLFFMFGGRR